MVEGVHGRTCRLYHIAVYDILHRHQVVLYLFFSEHRSKRILLQVLAEQQRHLQRLTEFDSSCMCYNTRVTDDLIETPGIGMHWQDFVERQCSL